MPLIDYHLNLRLTYKEKARGKEGREPSKEECLLRDRTLTTGNVL
jgi:hypothetical protein